MHFLPKEQRSQIFAIMNDAYYIDRVHYLQEFFEKTRDSSIRKDPNKLLGLQLQIAEFETDVWNVMREQRKVIRDFRSKKSLTDHESNELNRTLDGYESHRQLIRISRTIFDGVAWRELGYNRLFLTSSARKTSAGSFDLNLPSSKSLFSWAYSIQDAHQGMVLINDLTRFLRIGDLTEVYRGKAVIHELKKDGKRIINFKTVEQKSGKKITDQTRKMLELQTVAFSGRVPLQDGTFVDHLISKVNLQTHLKYIEALLERSEKEVVIRAQFEPFIQFSIINLQTAYKKPEKMRRYLKTFGYIPWNTEFMISQTNYDHFFYDELGNFIRNQVPFSVFPFSNEICMKIISGQILIQSTINYEIFVNELKKKGWQARIAVPEFSKDQDEINKHVFDNSKPIFSNLDEEDGLIEIKRGPFNMVLPHNWISMISMEFMTFETLNNLLEEIYAQASVVQKPMNIFPEFPNSSKIWS